MISLGFAPSAAANRSRRRDVLWLGCVAAAAAVAGCLVTQDVAVRALVALVAAAALVICAVVMPRGVLYGLIVWLFALGLVRRITGGAGAQLDPLLMVEPLVLGVLVVTSGSRAGPRDRSTLAVLVFVLSVLLVVSAFNPLQGSVAVGLGGLFLSVVPMLAFWVGRNIGDDQLVGRVLRLYAVLSVAAAGYGLYQIFVGLPPWDERWILQGGYAALNVGGVIRAFGTASSATEYAFFLVIGLVAWWTLGPRRAVVLPILAFIGCAIFYESSRSVVFAVTVTLSVLGALRVRLPFPLTVALGITAVFALVWLAGRVLPGTSGQHPTAALVEHQLGGLADPLNPKTSTLSLHFELFWTGLTSAFSDPFGKGVGAVTIAGSKFGGARHMTEVDPSNMAVALGLPGLTVYLSLVAVAFRRAYQVVRSRRDRLAFCALGVLLATTLQWFSGGNYSVAILVWLLLGWLSRQRAKPAPPPAAPQRPSKVDR
jgi:hypothetical protein